jgi:hypothetical protein
MNLGNRRNAGEVAAAAGSNTGVMYSTSCVEWTADNDYAVAGTSAGCRTARSDSCSAKSGLDTRTSVNEKKVLIVASFGRIDGCAVSAFDWLMHCGK